MTTHLDHVRVRYDSVPYASYAYPQCAPEHLAAVASLFGHTAPDPRTARVLELGGASGGNVIPFAVRNPAGQAVCLDLSEVQVDAGRAQVVRMGLQNMQMMAGDLAALDVAALGRFDYIVCHGLYSWVPAEIQDAMLRLCSQCLSEDGVVFVSYNTYPGWKAKEMLRDAMLLHSEGRDSTQEQVAYARAMVGFLQQVAPRDGLMAHVLQENLQYLRDPNDHYIAHEYLEPDNRPCYFQDFLARARGHGLDYLAEAQPSMMVPANYGAQIAEPLQRAFGHDQVRMEQYLDFAINRAFRQTLLVRAGHGTRDFALDRARLQALHFAARMPCRDGATRQDGSVQHYGAQDGTSIGTGLSAAKCAFDLLTVRWPATVSRDELVAHAFEAQRGPDRLPRERVEAATDELLQVLVVKGVARIRGQAIPAHASLERPHVDAGVRAMVAAQAPDSPHAADLWHEGLELSPAARALLPLMDGTRDRAALIASWTGDPARTGASAVGSAEQDVDTLLRWLAGVAVAAAPGG